MESTLNTKLETMAENPRLSQNSITALGKFVESAGPWDRYRINPYALAEDLNWQPDQTVDLFVQAARAGIFDFNYNLICPRCGGIAHAHHALDQIEEKEFYCAVCTVYSETTLDEQVEVSFAINPAVRKIEIDDLENLDTYRRYHFSANYVISDQLKALREELVKRLVTIEPDGSKRLELHAGRHSVWQLNSIDKNSSVVISLKRADGSTGASGSVTLTADGFTIPEMNSSESVCEVTVHNKTNTRQGFMVTTPDLPRIIEVATKYPTRIRKYLTAKMLLNNQTFRDLYRVQTLSKNLNLNIRSLTILFTDLRGSTAMYDKAGDVSAYSLVQEHFTLLTEAVRSHQGAIIKTMGDAIMATFSTPEDGIRAAVEMMSKIEAMNTRVSKDGYNIGLKVGIHEGPALAVMRDERLDYFGQTVNIAARVQGLAEAGEIWVSESVFSSPAVRDWSKQSGYREERQLAHLKGVGGDAVVYKLSN